MNKTAKSRLLYVLQCLWQSTDAEHYVTTAEILAYLKDNGIVCDRKTIPGDIEKLRDIFIVCLSAIITVATAVFCIQSYDEEDYILIIGALFFVILSFCLQLNALKLLDYVEVSNNQFIMCSVSGKRKCTINSDTLIYYQIVSLIEGTFSRTDFIVLSDQSFPCYQNGNGLAKVCKEINAKGNQIIMPYNKMSKPLLSLRDWHRIN